MDLLGQETVKPQKSNAKKKVLMLLVCSIILLIILLVILTILKKNSPKKLVLSVNDKNITITDKMFIQDENAKSYISIRTLAEAIGYDYIKGGYLEYQTDENKGYIDTTNQIIEYKAESEEICKITQDSSLGEENYKLKNKIIKKDGELYIALEDLSIGCNVTYKIPEGEYKIIIDSAKYSLEKYKKELEAQKIKVENSNDNQKAISYNMIIATNENQKVGVIDLDKVSVIAYKYSTMEFDEYSQNFIISSDKKYGVISKTGKTIVEPRYEKLAVINYSPLLYGVLLNNKYGVLNEYGNLIVNMEYDKLGYDDKNNLNEATFIIKKLPNDKTGIVVGKNDKYGIVDLKNGEIILDCIADKIYSKTLSSKEKGYYVEYNKTEIELDKFIEEQNTTTVVTTQQQT